MTHRAGGPLAAGAPAKPRERPDGGRHFVHAGQLVVAGEPTVLTTIVASCVSVCLWDRRRRCGGMNHFVLARAPHAPTPCERRWTYGDLAVPDLVARLVGMGGRLPDIEAKLFGGANLLGGQSELGARNAAIAEELLDDMGIPVVARDVGGRRGRKLLFSTADGGALVRLL
jgi:chemotaxis protein CheD